MTDAILYLKNMVTNQNFSSQYLSNERYNYELILMITLFVAVEWNSRTKIEPISGKGSWLKLALAITTIMALGTFSDYKEFIYFQF
jgi:alginate O-acetyltransferase complex protein AlgI